MRALGAIMKAAWEKGKVWTLLAESCMFSSTCLILKFEVSLVSHILLLFIAAETHEP